MRHELAPCWKCGHKKKPYIAAFGEIIAGGGLTAADAIKQECGWHANRIRAALGSSNCKGGEHE